MTAADNKGNDSLTAILFAVFAVACIVAFLVFRGGDVGYLPKLVGNLGGPLFGSGLIDSFCGAIFAVLVGWSWYATGRYWFEDIAVSDRWLRFSFQTAVGAALWSLVWFFLGIFGMYTPLLVLAPVITGLVFAGTLFFGWRGRRGRRSGRSPNHYGMLTIVGLPVLLAFAAALAPPTAKDTLLYHFAVPKVFIAQQGNAVVDGNIASYLAMGTEMHYVSAMLLGGYISPRAGEAAAGVTAFLFFPLLLAAVYGWCRQLDTLQRWALVGAAIVASIPTAFHVASSSYIDIALALFVTLAAYSLTRWWKEQTRGWILLIGIFLGAALSIKLTAIFVVAAFALVILLRARGAESAGKIVIGGLSALLLAGVVASPWYIRTWVATGSPVFPFYMSIWPGKANGWDVERSNLFQAMNSQYGGVDENKLNVATAPVRASIMAQPEQAEYYDGVLGVAFLLGLPILIWALWKFDLAVEVKIAAGVAGVMYLFWLFSSEQLRYLLPMLPLLAIAITASAEAVSQTRKSLGKVLQYSLVVACLCGIVTSFAWFCQKAPLRVVLGGETRDQYLARNLDYYPYYQSINAETPPNSRVWLINMRRDTYNIERPVFSDYLFEDWSLRKLVWESRNVQELRAKAAAINVQYVLARHDFLFDHARSTLVDDNAPAAVNETKLRMAKEFLLDPDRTVKADDKFSLTKVF